MERSDTRSGYACSAEAARSSQARSGARDTARIVVWTANDERRRPPALMAHDTSTSTRLDGLSILLVEDEQDLLDELAANLERAGATVVGASSLRAAEAALASRAFDLLISDIELRDGTGYDVARAASRSGRVGAMLALTGRRGDEAIDASRAAGFQMHLTKPCAPETLLHVARLLTNREGG